MEILVAAGAAVAGAALLAKVKARPQSIVSVPAKMKALLLVQGDPDFHKVRLQVLDIDTPKPRPGQVLVQMVASPINPSDDGEWRVPQVYSPPKPIGNEGSGVVVATGGGLSGWWMLGKRVAVVGSKTYMQYAVTSATTGLFSLPGNVATEDGCAYFINPFTVVGIVSTVMDQGEKAFIHTAAASQLGQMMVRYCRLKGVTLINVVRKPEQVKLLQDMGAELIVDTSSASWKEDLGNLIKQYKVRLAFDAVSGNMTGDILTMLPNRSAVYVYGRLASEPVGNIQALDLIYRGKQVKGWILTTWLTSGGILKSAARALNTSREVGRCLGTVFASHFQDTTMENALGDYIAVREGRGITGIKMRIRY